MRTDKEIAFVLRRQGKSYNEISSKLGMSRSTLSNWFKGVDFSDDIKKNLTKAAVHASTIRIKTLNKIRGDSLTALYLRAEKEAEVELRTHITNPLFVSAVVAYWGEGDKSVNSIVRLANTDPKMIKLFRSFLTEICNIGEDKIRGALYIYPNLNETVCRRYWAKQTGITRFHKTMVLPSRHKTKRLPYGTCTILVVNTYLKKKMLFWIDQLPEMVLNKGSK